MTLPRRTFMKTAALGAAAAGVSALSFAGQQESATAPLYAGPNLATSQDTPQPSAAQKAWMDMGFGLFIHFGINTYYDKEWSDGTLDPRGFDLVKPDTDQWCRAAVAAGMKYVVVVTKHHDGFCLWPTKYTDYSVRASSYKGDVLAELANSANKHGLKLGFYYSLWDRNNMLHDYNEQAYVDWMKLQLEELLTGYGPLCELWFDGFWKKQQSGWTKAVQDDTGEKVEAAARSTQRDEAFIQSWRMEGAYRWQMDHVYQFCKNLQPACMVMNNPTTAYKGVPLFPVDARCGEKYTEVKDDRKIWSWLGKDVYLPLQVETTLSVKGDEKFPSGNWFWHEWDKSVASKERLLQYLKTAQQMQANLLLNAGPDPKGRLRPEDEKALLSLRQ